MAGNQARGAAQRVEAFHAGNDGEPGIRFVIGLDLLARELGGERDFAVEVVRVRGAEARDLAIRLRPCGGMARVRVHDAADFGKRFVERDVGREIGRGRSEPSTVLPSRSVITMSAGGHLLVRDSAGFDHAKPVLARDGAGIAEGEDDQSTADQVEIGFENFLA